MKNKFNIIDRVKEIYLKGGNIIQFLREIDGSESNSINDILISYDFQAGSYINSANKNPEYIDNYTGALAKVISNLRPVSTIVEAGVGEATTLTNVATRLNNKNLLFGGFDISWSRIYMAKRYLSEKGVNADLYIGDIFATPFADNSVDLVYTSHSIEPNGGREEEAIRELYRITNKYLILLEPSYELGGEESRQRMLQLGYITNLKETIDKCGFNLIEYRLFDYSANPLNPTALYVIEKNEEASNSLSILPVCPVSKKKLIQGIDHFYCAESLLSYPKINSIPCLTSSNAVLTSKMDA